MQIFSSSSCPELTLNFFPRVQQAAGRNQWNKSPVRHWLMINRSSHFYLQTTVQFHRLVFLNYFFFFFLFCVLSPSVTQLPFPRCILSSISLNMKQKCVVFRCLQYRHRNSSTIIKCYDWTINIGTSINCQLLLLLNKLQTLSTSRPIDYTCSFHFLVNITERGISFPFFL